MKKSKEDWHDLACKLVLTRDNIFRILCNNFKGYRKKGYPWGYYKDHIKPLSEELDKLHLKLNQISQKTWINYGSKRSMKMRFRNIP
jgi:hypothetical protein